MTFLALVCPCGPGSTSRIVPAFHAATGRIGTDWANIPSADHPQGGGRSSNRAEGACPLSPHPRGMRQRRFPDGRAASRLTGTTGVPAALFRNPANCKLGPVLFGSRTSSTKAPGKMSSGVNFQPCQPLRNAPTRVIPPSIPSMAVIRQARVCPAGRASRTAWESRVSRVRTASPVMAAECLVSRNDDITVKDSNTVKFGFFVPAPSCVIHLETAAPRCRAVRGAPLP